MCLCLVFLCACVYVLLPPYRCDYVPTCVRFNCVYVPTRVRHALTLTLNMFQCAYTRAL